MAKTFSEKLKKQANYNNFNFTYLHFVNMTALLFQSMLVIAHSIPLPTSIFMRIQCLDKC